MRVALAQVDCDLGAVARNIQRARDVIDQARAQRADLVVFPELSITGYSLGAVPDDVALDADDPTLCSLSDADGEIGVVAGFLEQGKVHVHNSSVYLEAGRPVHVQRKLHLPTYGRFEEHKHCSPGHGLRAFDTRSGRFALLICNDAWQPPLPYLAVQDGAQALIVPACSAICTDAGSDGELERDWSDVLRFHARFLETYVVFVNRVGSEPGIAFWGGSRVIDPWGRVIAQAPGDEPAVLTVELDLNAVHRRRRETPLIKDARLDLLAREFSRIVRHEP